MIYKALGAFIIAAAAVLAFLSLQSEKSNESKKDSCVQLTPAQQLAKMINDDFNSLEKDQQLPPEWRSILNVEVRMNSSLAKALLGKQLPRIPRTQEGTTSLELEIMDLPDDENPGIIIQASLFDIKTKNKIFEIGRTYSMNDLNKVPATKEDDLKTQKPKEE